MRSIQKSLEILEKSKLFNEWKKEHKAAYLCNVFLIGEIKGIGNVPLQFDYYFRNKITSFTVDKEVKIGNEEEIFGKGDVEKLDINVRIPLENALEIAAGLGSEKYPNERFEKAIIIMQKSLWSITFLTQNFNVFNVKLDADKGDIIEEKLVSVFNFKKQ